MIQSDENIALALQAREQGPSILRDTRRFARNAEESPVYSCAATHSRSSEMSRYAPSNPPAIKFLRDTCRKKTVNARQQLGDILVAAEKQQIAQRRLQRRMLRRQRLKPIPPLCRLKVERFVQQATQLAPILRVH